MKHSYLEVLFQGFQKFIYNNKEGMRHYDIKPNPFLWLDYINPFKAKGFWFTACLIFNYFGLQTILETPNESIRLSALLSMLALLVSISSRTPIINRILFFLSRNTKNYLVHQIIYQLGLFHRYMALTSFFWLLVHITNKPIKAPYIDEALVVSLFVLMCIIILTAVKIFRTKQHDLFENIHRYFSYLALLILITYFVVCHQQQAVTLDQSILKPEFFILLFTVIFSVSPWFGVKKINPVLQHSGKHVAAFKIMGKPQYGSFSRITLGDAQFHSFGDSVFDVNDQNCFTLFITAAGDRTKAIVKAAQKGINLIEQCTMRRDRSFGFMNHVTNYDFVLIIATGGGIAPVLPHMALNKNTQIVVLWLGHDQVKEFSNTFLLNLRHKINTHNIRIHMLNSSLPWVKNMSQNQTVQFILQAYTHYKPEALFIVSNPALTAITLKACKQEGIKGYGATFDA